MDENDKEARGDDYTVGYRRPPKDKQFKPGKSGNPRGRPPKPKPTTVEEMIRLALDVPVKLAINGKPKCMTRREVIVERHVAHALAGKKGAIKALEELAKSSLMVLPVSPEADPYKWCNEDVLGDALKMLREATEAGE